MKTYTILLPFRDADGNHKPGDPDVQLSDSDAEELLEIGVIQELQSTVPTDSAERQAAIIEAIGKLDTEDSDLWLRDGKPDVSALVGLLGWPVSAAERNAAWESASLLPKIDHDHLRHPC